MQLSKLRFSLICGTYDININIYNYSKTLILCELTNKMQMKLNKRRSSGKIEVIDIDDLVLTRKGGGSIIDQRPVFSHDGE